MDYKEKFVPESDKLKPNNQNKVIISDVDYELLAVLNKIADFLGR